LVADGGVGNCYHTPAARSSEVKDMATREQNKPFIIWFMVMMLINFALLACAWVKMVQHQNDASFNFIMLFLVVNIVGFRIHRRMSRNIP
jgi:hypothetical protein